jgi:hypothetical protein
MQLKKIFLLFLGVTSSYKAMAVILSDLDKKNLINAMHDVKNAAATLNESRKLSTTSDSVHTTDTACRAIVEKIFSSPETLAYFVNHRTINEMESITRSNASEKLNELYANFFKREHILSFIKTELSPKKADILVKEKSYKMHDLTDFIKAIEKEDQKKKILMLCLKTPLTASLYTMRQGNKIAITVLGKLYLENSKSIMQNGLHLNLRPMSLLSNWFAFSKDFLQKTDSSFQTISHPSNVSSTR